MGNHDYTPEELDRLAAELGAPLTVATDPQAEAIAVITRAIAALADDPGAVLTDSARLAWDKVYDADPAAFERLRKSAKGAGARVTEIDKLVGARNKRVREKLRTNTRKSYTSYTSNTGKDLGAENPTSSVYAVLDNSIPCQPGLLVSGDDDKPRLLVASEAALLARDAMRGRYARSTEAAAWHRFTGTHWSPGKTTDEIHAALTAWLYRATDPLGFTPRYLDGILTLLERGNMLPLPVADPDVLPFKNGLLHMPTREFMAVTPATAVTWCVPYDYDPRATCPTIRAWLTQAVDGDAATVQLLRAWWAALLTGRADLQKFLHLPGPGGTGKGVFMRISEALVGERNATATDLRSLEQNQFEGAALYQKRLVTISDTDKYGGSVNKLKALTGQDAIRLERKHQQQDGTFVFAGQVLIASNEPLATTDLTSGLERRRITVTFGRQATTEEREHWRQAGGERAVLHRELPGLVNWVLCLTPEEVSASITAPPERTQKANLAALTAGNPVAGWLVECCKPERDTWTQIGVKDELRRPEDGRVSYKNDDTHLYPSYLAWSRRTGREPLAQRRFRHATADVARTLGAQVLEVRRSDGMGIQGLALLKDGEQGHRAWIDDGTEEKSPPSYTAYTPDVGFSDANPLKVLEVYDVLDFRPTSDFARAKKESITGEEVF